MYQQAQHFSFLSYILHSVSVIRTISPSATLVLTQYTFTDVITLRPRPDVCATLTAMASGKKSALLSSLADYGDDSEPDSDPEIEETGTR